MMADSDSRAVLIVDDDEALAKLMRRALEKAGFTASCATSGTEALSRLTLRRPELLVLDFALPDMNGLELLEAIRREGAEVPFIVVTGRDDHQLAVHMMKRGARDYIVKDQSLLELLPSVANQAFEQMDRDRRLTEAEARVREQKRFLETILNSLSHPLYVLDADEGKVEMVNRAALASGRTAFSLSLSGTPQSPVEQVKENKVPLSFEHVHSGPAGQSSVHEVYVYPVFNDAGEVKQIIEYDLEITNRKKAEQALRVSEARLRQVLESLPVVLLSRDAKSKQLMVLAGRAQEILGHEPDAFLESPDLFFKIVDPQDAPILRRALTDSRAERRALETDFRVRHDDGRTVWIHARAVPIYDEHGELVRIDSILVDATQEKQIAWERQQLEQHLEQKQRLESLGVLAGGIAHDFSNLLTVISGNLQFLRESLQLGPAESKALGDMETAVRNASDMTRSLQAFSRPNKPEIVTVDLNELIQEVYRFLRRLIPVRIDFQFIPATSPCMVSADPAQLQQVLINVCLNARDAVTAHGQIDVRTRSISRDELPGELRREAENARYVELSVSDSGQGMDEQTVQKMFDPFFTTKPKDQGTGLGLALVYRIVRAHSGLVHVTSTPDLGTQFLLFLPETGVERRPTPSHPPIVRNTEQILVVDDDEMIASLIKTVLESNGYTVAVAHCPEEAIAYSQSASEPIALTVIDYGLPDMSGPQCILRLREQWPELKAILITGYQVDEGQMGVQNVQVLQKPFSPRLIAEAVHNALGKSN